MPTTTQKSSHVMSQETIESLGFVRNPPLGRRIAQDFKLKALAGLATQW